MSEENITLDPEYKDLIIEVNGLKDKAAEKIAERDYIAFHEIPQIENEYMIRLGFLESETFTENLAYLRARRKLDLYKNKMDNKEKFTENEIEEQLSIEFDGLQKSYDDIQEDVVFDYESSYFEESSKKMLETANVVYAKIVHRLNPTINFENTRIENQLYEIAEKAYRELNISMLSRIQLISNYIDNKNSLLIGDMNYLKELKSKYEDVIKDNEEILIELKCSEAYEKKTILNDENFIRRIKKEVSNEIGVLEKKINAFEAEIEKLKKQNNDK